MFDSTLPTVYLFDAAYVDAVGETRTHTRALVSGPASTAVQLAVQKILGSANGASIQAPNSKFNVVRL